MKTREDFPYEKILELNKRSTKGEKMNCPDCGTTLTEITIKHGSHIFDHGPKKGGRKPKQQLNKLLICTKCGYETGREGRDP